MKFALKSLLAAALAATAVASQAAVVAIDPAAFVFSAGQITFSEAAIGTPNPSFAAVDYGGTGTVSFGSMFSGQVYDSSACAAGTQPAGCVGGTPTGPLALRTAGVLGTSIVADESHTTSPVLAGNGTTGFPFSGAIAMLFGVDQAGVAFDAGFFNSIGAVQVTAYGRDGRSLGSVRNTICGSPETPPPAPPASSPQVPGCTAPFSTGNGIESIILGTNDGAAQIAGLLISLVAPEQLGFTIDNIRFGAVAPTTSTSTSGSTSSNGGTNQTPEPTSMALVGLALITLALARRRRSNAAI